jgi:hypothetical protein
MSDLYAVIRRERELRLQDVERQRGLGLIEPGRPLRWFHAIRLAHIGNPIASWTHGRRGETSPRPASPR